MTDRPPCIICGKHDGLKLWIVAAPGENPFGRTFCSSCQERFFPACFLCVDVCADNDNIGWHYASVHGLQAKTTAEAKREICERIKREIVEDEERMEKELTT